MLDIYFFGTSSGVPTKERNVSGTALKLPHTKSWFLIDCGEGTQQQILNSPFSLANIKAILITHVHGDHCYGLPGLIASTAMTGRTEPLIIIAPKEIQTMYLAIKECTQLHTPFEIVFIETREIKEPYMIDSLAILPVALSHRVESHAFSFTYTETRNTLLKDKLLDLDIQPGPVWSQIQNNQNVSLDNGTELIAKDFLDIETKLYKVIIAGDNDQPDLLEKASKNVDLIVHEATYTQAILEKVGPGPQHSSAQKIAAFAEKNKVPNLILSHFSARYQSGEKITKSSINEIHIEAKSEYSGSLFLAKDHDSYTLNKQGDVILNSCS